MSPQHHDYIPRKAATGKIVLPEPSKLRRSSKKIPSYKADKKKPNVTTYPTQDDRKILNNWETGHFSNAENERKSYHLASKIQGGHN